MRLSTLAGVLYPAEGGICAPGTDLSALREADSDAGEAISGIKWINTHAYSKMCVQYYPIGTLMVEQTTYEKARAIFRDHGGTLRTGEALDAGVHPRTLYELRDVGELIQLARGVYRLAEMPPLSHPDLATVCKRVPQGVICLISALAFHELTTQIPHVVHLAITRTARTPSLEYPPLQVYRFSGQAYEAGIETLTSDGIKVRIYSAEKTLADCFKYRNKIGLDVAIEALRTYRSQRGGRLQQVLEYARICRVEQVIRPYLEAST